MRHLRVVVTSLAVLAAVMGCSNRSNGGGESKIVPRTLVPLTTSGEKFVTQQADYAAAVAAVDGAFSVAPAGKTLPSTPQFVTSAIVRGASSVDFGAAGAVSDGRGGVGVGRGSVLEQIQAVAQGLEVSWTFPAAPEGSGDVLVQVRTAGLELVSGAAEGTVLRDPSTDAQLRVGRALWVDAAGVTTAVAQSFAGGVVTFRVPEALLRSSAYPAVLDPLVTPASLGQVAFDAGVAAGTINGLAVGVSGPGKVTSTDGAIDCGAGATTCTGSYTSDSMVTLTATPIETGAEQKNYFVGWSGLCAGTSPCTVPMSKARFVYAYFEPAFWLLDIVKVGKGTGTITWNGNTCPPASTRCSFQVQNTRPVRQTAILAVTADADSSFTGWSADCGPAACSLYMDRPKHAYATFAKNVVTVKVEVDEVGTVYGPNGFSCPPGGSRSFTVARNPSQQVVLTTDPSATFYAWGGDCRGSDVTCTLTLDDDKTVYASWRGIHLARVGALGDVTVFAASNQDHPAGTSAQMACTNCHQANLLSQHARHCEYCHSPGGPAEQLIDRWDGSCSAGSCHGSIHAASGDNHHGVYWGSSASCALCHTAGGDFPGPADGCTRCHDPGVVTAGDTTPPVTTSDAKATYVGSGSIHLTATDSGSGVMTTFYQDVVHGNWVVGTDASTGRAPTSGAGINYTLYFYSVDHAGNQEAMRSVQYTVLPAAPSAPTGVSATPGNAQATITWTAGTSSTSSIVRYGTASGVYTNTIDPAVSPLTITGLTNGTAYYYQVGAKSSSGTAWAAQDVVIPALPPVPSAPTGISAAAGNAQATITWTAGAGSTSSVVRYGTTSGVYTTTLDPAVSPRTITGLTNGTAIYYQVGAKNVAGTTWSAQGTVTPMPSLPSAPTGITSTPGDAQATISWAAGSGSTSSLIRYGTVSGSYTTTVDPATSPQTISGLTNGTVFYYQVGAKNSAGTTWSGQYSVTPMPTTPAAPTGIVAVAGNTQVTLSWTAGAGATSSLVRYGTASGLYTTTINPAVSPLTIAGLTNGVAIFYQVGASNVAGTTWAPESNATPVAASGGSLTWTAPGTYTFTVPAGVTTLSIDSLGGGGQGGTYVSPAPGANGGNATILYGALTITAGGGYGGQSAYNTSQNKPGGAGGTSSCTGSSSICSSLTMTNGGAGQSGWDDGNGAGYGGAGGSPNGQAGADAVEDWLGGSGGGGGGAEIVGALAVTPGSSMTIAVGTGSSVKVTW